MIVGATALAQSTREGMVSGVGHAGAILIAQAPVIAPASAGELRGRLEHVRAGGLIGDFRAGNRGACHLAAPIMDAAGSVVAALSVQAPRARWQIHKHGFTCALRSAALRLTSMVVRA